MPDPLVPNRSVMVMVIVPRGVEKEQGKMVSRKIPGGRNGRLVDVLLLELLLLLRRGRRLVSLRVLVVRLLLIRCLMTA